MAYFRVDVKTELLKTFMVEAPTALDAEIMARQAATQNSSNDAIHKVEENSQIAVSLSRLPDDGDLYRSERLHRLVS